MSRRRKRDSDKPKKALTAYVLYCGSKRPELMKENPEMKFVDVGRELGKLWKELGDDDRAPFIAEAEERKKQYDVDIKKYKEEHPDSSDEDKRSKKRRKTSKKHDSKKKGKKPKKRDPKAPKRAQNAYHYYQLEMKAEAKKENPSSNYQAINKILTEKWKSLGTDDRKPYVELADGDKERFQKEKAKYKAPESSDSESSSSESEQDSESSSDESSSSESEKEAPKKAPAKKAATKKRPQKKVEKSSSESESD